MNVHYYFAMLFFSFLGTSVFIQSSDDLSDEEPQAREGLRRSSRSLPIITFVESNEADQQKAKKQQRRKRMNAAVREGTIRTLGADGQVVKQKIK